jgi:hypothetical protein
MRTITPDELDRYKVALNLACFYLPPSQDKLKLELESLQELIAEEAK